jgi:hypothetical protein
LRISWRPPIPLLCAEIEAVLPVTSLQPRPVSGACLLGEVLPAMLAVIAAFWLGCDVRWWIEQRW